MGGLSSRPLIIPSSLSRSKGGDSVSSSQPSLSERQEGNVARTKELLKAVSLRVRNLERGAARVDSTLVTSFEGVCFKLNDV